MEGSQFDAVGSCEFLLGRNIDGATLRAAEMQAAITHRPVHDVLLSNGWVTARDYTRRLAEALGIPHTLAGPTAPGAVLVDATAEPPEVVEEHVGALLAIGARPLLWTSHIPQSADTPQRAHERLDAAVFDLHRRSPDFSASGRTWLWQKLAVALTTGGAMGMAIVNTPLAYFVLTFIAAIPFAFVVAQRFAAFVVAALMVPAPSRRRAAKHVGNGQDLPVYTVLVPLFREAEVLPDLIQALRALDYPPEKLDILIVLEAVDLESQNALKRLCLPPQIRVIVVPDAPPRTKPKALNFALQFARGAFVAVYDAEDVPAPDQLRRALAMFQRSPARVGCIQARLNIHNRGASWLTRGIMAQTPQELNPICAHIQGYE